MISIIAALILSAAPAVSPGSPLASADASAVSSMPGVSVSLNPGVSADSVKEPILANTHVPQPSTPTLESAPVTSGDELERQKQEEAFVASVIRNGGRLFQSCRWREALALYESALHKVPASLPLQAQYSRAKIACDIQKRFASPYHLRMIRDMTALQLRLFVQDFFRIHTQCYFQRLSPQDIYVREIRCMEIALTNSIFCENVLSEFPKSEVAQFRKEICTLAATRQINSLEELVEGTLELGNCFQNRFNRNGACLVLEGLFDFTVSLDSYSEVMLPVQYESLLSTVRGNMVGVGVEFRCVDGRTEVVDLVPHSPASEVMRKGDLILAVEGFPVQNWTVERIAEKMNGPAETPLHMTIQSGADAPRNVTIMRKALTISSISHSRILPNSDGVAYIRLSNFQNNTPQEINQELEELSRQGMKHLILDIRGNPGGPLQAGIETTDLFVRSGTLLITKDCRGEKIYPAHDKNTWDVPLTVLIDEKSASASEIFAGAIQSHARGVLVGTRSFGKGTIQSTIPIPGSQFVSKITISQFYAPNGVAYNYSGVTPDYIVRQSGKPVFEDFDDVELLASRSVEYETAGSGTDVMGGVPVKVVAESTHESGVELPPSDAVLEMAMTILKNQK